MKKFLGEMVPAFLYMFVYGVFVYAGYLRIQANDWDVASMFILVGLCTLFTTLIVVSLIDIKNAIKKD